MGALCRHFWTRAWPQRRTIEVAEETAVPVQLLNSYQMHYEVYGQGPPMVMIHGGLGGGEGSAAFIEHQATALSRRFKLIVYDRRTSGRSSTPEEG